MRDRTTLGIDVGGTKLLAVCLDEAGSPLDEWTVASPPDGDRLVTAITEAAGELCGGRPAAVGVGVPGLVDASGVVRFAPNLLGIGGTPLRDALSERFPGCAFWIGNDATAACWAEHAAGAAEGASDVLIVTLGTGIGGGIVSSGRLVEGAHGYAGEFGHLGVDPEVPECPCGRRGCWERFASGEALGAAGREAARAGRASRVLELAAGHAEAVRGEHVAAAALEGDDEAVHIMDRFGWWVAMGLASLANILDPEAIVIGGGLVGAGEALMEPVRRWFAAMVEAPEARDRTRLVMASLGPRAGAIGAGLLARA